MFDFYNMLLDGNQLEKCDGFTVRYGNDADKGDYVEVIQSTESCSRISKYYENSADEDCYLNFGSHSLYVEMFQMRDEEGNLMEDETEGMYQINVDGEIYYNYIPKEFAEAIYDALIYKR